MIRTFVGMGNGSVSIRRNCDATDRSFTLSRCWPRILISSRPCSSADTVTQDGQDDRMETHVRTPMEIFHLPQHLVVPLFQRPYVWNEEEQWLPLWQDVRRMAELRLQDPYGSATHFLGAVVVQAHESQLGHIPASNIIDGQQRLTTLQLLMDAAASILEEAGFDALAGQLDGLTHNQDNFVQPGVAKLKVRHTNRDKAAFDEVMDADPPIDHSALKHSGSLLVRAHQFFAESVSEWLGDVTSDDFGSRADALTFVLTRGLELVAINLRASEDSQEIFETLNARGTPLTAADLIKNFVFQRLEAEGVDMQRAYAEDWPFESKFWESEVSVGRYSMSRGSVFLTQWLGSRTGEEVSPRSTFSQFKYYVEHVSGQKMSELLPLIKQQADLYEAWTTAADDSDRALTPVEMCVYRMNTSGVEVLKPLLIWLHEPGKDLPANVVADVVCAVESWLVRRQILRLPSADLGRSVADLIRLHRDTLADELPDRVRGYLTRLGTASSFWPGDEEIRKTLLTEAVYRRFRPRRLRMFLEAIEDRLRSVSSQPPVPRRGYPIEHVMPQSWTTNWPVDGLEAELERGAHIHRLGNLTLLTQKLNSSVSNGPWGGEKGKRAKLQEHDTFLMNRIFRDGATESWDEVRIDQRTADMIDALLEIWSVPSGHLGEISDPQDKAQAWIEIKDLLAAGLLEPGTRLVPRPGQWSSSEAIVRPDGMLEVDGKIFETPSGAGKYVKDGVTNGWYFWRLPDGRKLVDIRSIYRGEEQDARADFDWSRLHMILEALPTAHWTSYANLADAVGTAPQPLGNHMTACHQCVNAHRVLTHDGKVAPNFRWTDPDDLRDPADLLCEEGLAITDGKADLNRQLSSDDLAALVGEQRD